MNNSTSTFQMAVPPASIISLLTAGAIKAMVTGDAAVESSSTRWNTKTKSSNTLFTVLAYPCTLISLPGPNNSLVSTIHDYYLYDGEHNVRVQILDNNALDEIFMDFGSSVLVARTNRDHIKMYCALINIKSYVTSLANLNQDEPILCLTGIDICEQERIKAYSMQRQRTNQAATAGCFRWIPPGVLFKTAQGRILSGKFVDFLANVAPFMSYETLSGCHYKPTSVASDYKNEHKRKIMKLNIDRGGHVSSRDRIDANYDETSAKLEIIASFLSRYQAMNTLATLSSKEDHEARARVPPSIATQMTLIESFCKSQLELHKASITANSGRSEPSTTTRIIEQHQEVLREIYDHNIPLINHSTDIHIDMLHYCHTKLCRDLIPSAGKFRTATVRVSTTNFVYHDQMQDIVSRLLLSLQTLRTRLVYLSYDTATMTNHLSTPPSHVLSGRSTSLFGTSSRVSNQNGEPRTIVRSTEQHRILAVLTYAAAACMGILDTHPYFDGNEWLARIVLNFILYNHLHLPFPVPLFATPEQRLEYTQAICRTRQNIALCPVGDVPDDLLIEAYENCGALQPMVHLILDRIFKSVTECNNQIVVNVSVHSEEIDARTARHVRERTLNTDDCLICFQKPPNMSTLCCGTAYHVKCLTQWLKTNGKCPHCRFEMPCLEETNDLSDLQRDLRRIILDLNF
jgi:Ring finger domain